MSLTTTPDDFWRHVLNGATEAVRPALSSAELLGETEICQHDVAFRVQEYVLQFDVAVDYAELEGRKDKEFRKYCFGFCAVLD